MNRPDILAKQTEIYQWVDDVVRPYLISLLNRAQSRTKRPIKFYNSMGLCFIDFNEVRDDTPGSRIPLNDVIQSNVDNLLKRRFPELVELLKITYELHYRLNVDVGNIVPTVRPKKTRPKR